MSSEKKSEKQSSAEELRGFQALNKAYNEDFKRQAQNLTDKIKSLYNGVDL